MTQPKLLEMIAAIATAGLIGCAGSPMHTANLSPGELTKIDDETLCIGATPREAYKPTPLIKAEVKRRGLDCSELYSYTPLPQVSVPMNPSSGRSTTNCTAYGNSVTCNTKERGW